MKKICSLFLALTLLCGLWLSAGAEKATLESGSYTVGSDLPAGDYEITCVKVSNFYTDYMDSMQSLVGDDPEMNALFGLYGSLGDTMEASVRIKGTYGENKGSFTLKANDKKKLTLQKDWVITIEDGVLDFELVKATEESTTDDENTSATKAATVALDIDLSNYSDDEIVALYEMVGQEIVSRKLGRSAKVPSGTYIVGVDIPAGKYKVERLHDDSYDYIEIYTDQTKELKLTYESMWNDESCVISVEEGNALVLSSDLLFTVYTGITFN